MAEHEKIRKKNELKVKKRDYTGYDDDEFIDGNEGTKRKLLAKYDEELEGGTETVSSSNANLCQKVLTLCMY
jgi:U4/U6.U5 tri-snRNP-associated protein 1